MANQDDVANHQKAIQNRQDQIDASGGQDCSVAFSARFSPDGRWVVTAGGSVLVVEGRPRYHVAGCRYLTGKDVAEVPVDKARSDGFTACGVCKPDEALTAAPAASASTEPVVDPVAAARKTTRQAPTRTATKAPAAKARAATSPARAAAGGSGPSGRKRVG